MTLGTIRQDIFNIPNILTLFRIVLIPVVCIFLFNGDPTSNLIAVVLFWIASVTDWVDGYLARKLNLVSITGKFLDPLADKLLVMACLIMLLPQGRIPASIVIILLARETTISSLRAIAATEGYVISAGEGGKFKTSFQMVGLLGLMIHYTYEVPYYFMRVKINFHVLGYWLLLISLVFSISSAVEYFKGFMEAIKAFQHDRAKESEANG